MASIKWYRGAKRVRDNPSAPKSLTPKVPKKRGLPRFPKIIKPKVRLPFVKAVNHTTFGPNLSAAGLSAVMRIAQANGLQAGLVRWIRSTHDELDCPPVQKGSIYRLCDVLASKTWPNLESFMADSRGQGDGIWAISHVNCRCHITVKLYDPKDANRYAVFEVYTDPIEGAGRGNTIAGGYAWAEGTIPEEELAGLSFKQITDLNKMDSSDSGERREYKNKDDIFDQKMRPTSPEWFDNDPAYVEQPLPGSKPITGPAVEAPSSFTTPQPAPEPEVKPAEKPPVPQPKEETEEERRKREEEEAKNKGFLG